MAQTQRSAAAADDQGRHSAGMSDALDAEAQSRQVLDAVRCRGPEVALVAEKLRRARQVNHFSERLAAALRAEPEGRRHARGG